MMSCVYQMLLQSNMHTHLWRAKSNCYECRDFLYCGFLLVKTHQNLFKNSKNLAATFFMDAGVCTGERPLSRLSWHMSVQTQVGHHSLPTVNEMCCCWKACLPVKTPAASLCLADRRLDQASQAANQTKINAEQNAHGKQLSFKMVTRLNQHGRRLDQHGHSSWPTVITNHDSRPVITIGHDDSWPTVITRLDPQWSKVLANMVIHLDQQWPLVLTNSDHWF